MHTCRDGILPVSLVVCPRSRRGGSCARPKNKMSLLSMQVACKAYQYHQPRVLPWVDVKRLLSSNELGFTQNEASNNVFTSLWLGWFTTTPPPPYPVGAGLVPARVPTHPPSPSRHREGAQPHLRGARSLRYRSLKAVAVMFLRNRVAISCVRCAHLAQLCSTVFTTSTTILLYWSTLESFKQL